MGNEKLISHIEKHLRHIEDRKIGGFEWDKNNAEVYRIALAALASEARTLTVTCPDVMPPEAAPAHYWGDGESMAYADGYNKASSDLKVSIDHACRAAGIKLQIEGE